MKIKPRSAKPPRKPQQQWFSFTLQNNTTVRVLPFCLKEDIKDRVHEIGKTLYDFCVRKGIGSITVVSVLSGGAVFAADLIRALNDEQRKKKGDPPLRNLSVHMQVVMARSYEGLERKPVQVNLGLLDDSRIRGQVVILADDIVDTGGTLRAVYDRLVERGAHVVIPVVLFLKEGRQHPQNGIGPDPDPSSDRLLIDNHQPPSAAPAGAEGLPVLEGKDLWGYFGFLCEPEVGPEHVVGNGMDYNDHLRDLQWVGVVDPDPQETAPSPRRVRRGKPR
jgi:hypoxanthine phosphoribosyltransferase